MRSHLVVGLDIGATRTTALIAEVDGQYPAHWIEVLGVGQVNTNGVQREVVRDVEEMAERVGKAVREAELMAGCTVNSVYVGISGDQVETFASHGVVAISDNEVSPDDLARLHAVARAVALPHDRELLHTVPQSYTVDRTSGILHPVGMPGTRLESDVYLVTGASAIANNIRSAVSRAGYRVEKLILEPLAAARAALREDEKEIGVALLDLGGTTTQMAVFVDGRVYHTNMLPTGGVALTWDLVQHLHLPYEEARRVLESHGCVLPEFVDPQRHGRDPRPHSIEAPPHRPGHDRQRPARPHGGDLRLVSAGAGGATADRSPGDGGRPHGRSGRAGRGRGVRPARSGNAGSHRGSRRGRDRTVRLHKPVSPLDGGRRGPVRGRPLCQDWTGGARPHVRSRRKGWSLAQGILLSA